VKLRLPSPRHQLFADLADFLMALALIGLVVAAFRA
jgi:hypothetical protein